MLELNNITTGYGKLRVLKDVSIKVDTGEIVSVVGANGAGKNHPHAGHIRHHPHLEREQDLPGRRSYKIRTHEDNP